MKDRDAAHTRPIKIGIAYGSLYPNRFAGVESNFGTKTEMGFQYGTPSLTGNLDKPVATCAGTTKAGNPCSARRVAGESLCQGHLNKLKKEENDKSGTESTG